MKYDVQFTNQFKKDLKLAKKQNKNLDKLFEVIAILANGGTLDTRFREFGEDEDIVICKHCKRLYRQRIEEQAPGF